MIIELWNDLIRWIRSDEGFAIITGVVLPFVAILAAGIDRSNPRQIKENSPNLGDSSLDILALKRRRGQQLRTRVGDVE